MSSERRPRPTANYQLDRPSDKGPQLSFNINQGYGPGLDVLSSQLTRGFRLAETSGGYLLSGGDEAALTYAFRQLCTLNNWTPRHFG